MTPPISEAPLIFYHHGSVDELLAEASRTVTHHRAQTYADRLSTVDTFTDLAAEARALHREERAAGHLIVLTQLLAGARTRPLPAGVLKENFGLLFAPVEEALDRMLTGSALEEVVTPAQLAHSVACRFLGYQLLDGVITDADPSAFDTLDTLAALVDLTLNAGVIEAGLLRRRLRSVQDHQ